jgi:hypothetical protein
VSSLNTPEYRTQCQRIGGEMWFPHQGETLVAERAKAICRRCRARTACLDLAMRAEETQGQYSRFGIFGGLSGDERKALADTETEARALEGRTW